MLATVVIVCVAILAGAMLMQRARNRAELERHSITAEELRASLAAGHDVALFDVRLPLDLLSHTVVIPGAQRLSPEEIIANPSLIPRDRDAVVYCTCPSDRTSRAVLQRARAIGILRIRFLKGGLESWKSRGFPVEPYEKSFHLSSGNKGAAVTG